MVKVRNPISAFIKINNEIKNMMLRWNK